MPKKARKAPISADLSRSGSIIGSGRGRDVARLWGFCTQACFLPREPSGCLLSLALKLTAEFIILHEWEEGPALVGYLPS